LKKTHPTPDTSRPFGASGISSPKKNRLTGSLFWKLSAVFLVVLTLVGAAYIWLTFFTSEMYFAETSQRLNADLAQHVVDEIQPIINGEPNQEALAEIFHDVMVVNPAVEVYLLDSTGTIMAFDAPPEKVKAKNVSLDPVEEFLSSGSSHMVLGDNPRNADRPRVFSAAPVLVDGRRAGYIYVILRGEEYDSAADRIRESHILLLALQGLALSLVAAGIIGLVALALVTRKLRRISRTVQAFKEGDYSQRFETTSDDELDRLGGTFNDMAETIEATLDQLKHADALRRELIANVSHDLRTPLASMQGYIETVLMKNGTLQPGERDEFLRIVLGGTERLSKLVEELFELSKLEARQTRPRPEDFSLPELLNDVIQKFGPLAERHAVTISADFPERLPPVHADLGLIERALQNLLENAVKYNRQGGRVRVRVERSNGKVRTLVIDTGIGIPEKDLPHVFDRFYRSRRSGTAAGAGLGLAITKKILEAHGETVSVESEVGSGTTFSFQLSCTS
jgi:signal transduction histidine kinase